MTPKTSPELIKKSADEIEALVSKLTDSSQIELAAIELLLSELKNGYVADEHLTAYREIIKRQQDEQLLIIDELARHTLKPN